MDIYPIQYSKLSYISLFLNSCVVILNKMCPVHFFILQQTTEEKETEIRQLRLENKKLKEDLENRKVGGF